MGREGPFKWRESREQLSCQTLLKEAVAFFILFRKEELDIKV